MNSYTGSNEHTQLQASAFCTSTLKRRIRTWMLLRPSYTSNPFVRMESRQTNFSPYYTVTTQYDFRRYHTYFSIPSSYDLTKPSTYWHTEIQLELYGPPRLHIHFPSTEVFIKDAIFSDLGVNVHFEGPKSLIKPGRY